MNQDSLIRFRLQMESGGKRRILVVDDEPDVRNTVSMLLKHFGFDTEIAGTASEAIGFLEDGKFDLVFTDILMPGGTGELIHSYIKEQALQVRIIFMSGSVPIGLEERLELRVGENFLRKPFSLSDVRAILLQVFPDAKFPPSRAAQPRKNGAP